ncbi:MAG TPA: TolC family protein, partial [Mizugakiibacter sp.]|nr:TolC family protein [Mizugakiibacter sp.]
MADWRSAARGFLASVFALLLAGCASAPPVPQLNVTLPNTWRLNSPTERLGPAPDLRSWWSIFHDADMERLVKQVLAQNLGIRAAAERLAAARSLETTALGSFRPTVGIQSGATPTPGATRSYYQINFDASWQLGLFGRSTSSARIAAGNAQLARADLSAARVAVVAESVRDYLNLRAAQQRVRMQQHLVDLQRHQLTLQKVLVAEHLRNPSRLAQAQAVLGTQITASAEAHAAVQIAAQKIALLLGHVAPPQWLYQPAPSP